MNCDGTEIDWQTWWARRKIEMKRRLTERFLRENGLTNKLDDVRPCLDRDCIPETKCTDKCLDAGGGEGGGGGGGFAVDGMSKD